MPEKYALQKQAHVRLIKLANAAAVIRRTRGQIKRAHESASTGGVGNAASGASLLGKPRRFMQDNPGYSAAIGAGIGGLLGLAAKGVSGGLIGAGLGGLAGYGGSKYLQRQPTPEEYTYPPAESEPEDPKAMVGADLVTPEIDTRDYTDGALASTPIDEESIRASLPGRLQPVPSKMVRVLDINRIDGAPYYRRDPKLGDPLNPKLDTAEFVPSDSALSFDSDAVRLANPVKTRTPFVDPMDVGNYVPTGEYTVTLPAYSIQTH